MNQTKQALFDAGVDIATRFFEHNNIDLCPISDTSRSCHYGFYLKRRGIYINTRLCKVPALTPGYAWSYPCFKSDTTPLGVIAHEAGHHVSYAGGYKDNLRVIWMYVCDREPFITSYDANHHDLYEESFAESMRLFIINTDLLRLGRPMRYSCLTDMFKLSPIETRTWDEVLQDAHPKYIQAAISWVRKGIK